MSETLRDLVVSLSLNSDNFTRNIKSINKQIQEAESAFRLASAGVENFETTTAGLSSKLSTLQRTFQLQQDAVGQYQRALQQASDKLQECYTRQNDYAQRLADAKDKQLQLKTEVASAAQAYKHYKNTLGETDSATIAAKANLDAYKGEYRAAVQEVRKLEGQNVALKKSTQNAADAFSAAQTKLNGAKGAVKETAAEIDQCNRQLALSRTSWASAGEAIQASQRSIASIGKQMKTAESSYRLAAAGVKDFDKSTAGLTAKLTLLQEKLGLQQKAVAEYEKALAAAKEQLQAAQQVNDPDKIREATDAVQDAETALNNARAAVKQTQADIANCNKELKTAQSEWTKAGKSLESFGKSCDSISKNLTPSVELVTQQYQTSTYGTQIYKITTKSGPLHLRSGTGTNYKILGKYKKGREVIVLNKTTSSWYEVTAPDGKHGYMASQYLTFQRTETQTVQTNVGFRNQVIEARQLRDQPFRIYRVVPELDKVTVYARHIFYDLLDNMVKSLKPSPSAVGASVVQSLSGACLSSHDFSFYSDLTSTAEDVEWENVNPVEAMLGENGLVSKYGAELARDWYDVFLVRRVGNNTDVSIREKKNLTGISYDVDETDVVTRIMPTGEDADGNILYLPELYIDSPNLNAYTHPKWIHLPVSEAREVTDGDEPKSKAQCYAEMRKAAQAEFDAGCDLPTVTLKVDFINYSDAEEYKQYAALTDIFLGDSVRVIARRIGVEVSMRMTQYTYDCLTRKYTSVTLGMATDTLEGSMISSRQLPSGVISGSKLAINSVGAGQLQSGSVGSLQVKMAAIQTAHIQDAAITKAKIAEATIGELNATAITAISAKIQELAAKNITTDELYAALATIAVAQITAANIEKANINWADIGELAAQIATIRPRANRPNARW